MREGDKGLVYHFVFEFIVFFFGLGVFMVPSGIPFNWWVIPMVSVLLFLAELRKSPRSNVRTALIVGLFLMSFDFAFENTGTLIFGLWGTMGSSLFVLAVPIEVMLTCFFGGAAWALYVMAVHTMLQEKLKNHFSGRLASYFILLDVLFFGVGGASAEWCLIQRKVMYYDRGWTSLHAFVSYFGMWALLHILLHVLTRRRLAFTVSAGGLDLPTKTNRSHLSARDASAESKDQQ